MAREVAEIFAERVQSRLDEMDRSTDWLGERLGIDGSGVRKVLNQKRAPRIDTVARWAEKLSVPSAWLIGSDEHESERALRLACVGAVLRASRSQLGVLRETFPDLFEAALNQPESGSL